MMRWLWVVLCVLGACSNGTGSGNGGDGDGDGDADSDADSDADGDSDVDADGDSTGPGCFDALPVDMIWVIDNSHSMREEQENLAANFPALIDVLTTPTDVNADGVDDFPPVDDLRVGIISTDMGVGEFHVVGCDPSGDLGELISEARGDADECAGMTISPDPWIHFDGENADDFAAQFACLARLGTDGCGYEQHLDSTLRSLATLTGEGLPNAGFVRDDSLLVIVLVTDEDDCSTSDNSMFDSTGAALTELGPTGTRCAFNPDLLFPVSHHVSGLDIFNLDRPGVVVAAIAGVPPDLVADTSAIDYDELLADERMQYRIDPDDEMQLLPACTMSGVGSAAPARRIVEFVRTLSPGERGLVQSICATDLRPAMEAIAALITRRLCDQVY